MKAAQEKKFKLARKLIAPEKIEKGKPKMKLAQFPSKKQRSGAS